MKSINKMLCHPKEGIAVNLPILDGEAEAYRIIFGSRLTSGEISLSLI